MSSPDDKYEIVTPGLYVQAYDDLDRLRTQLPEGAVVSLAREVLLRMAKMRNVHNVGAGRITDLSKALISSDATQAARLIEEYHREGANIDALYLDYLAPAAHMLGEWWEKDEISFAAVTIGTGRIYAVMRNLARRFPALSLPEEKTAFFASVPEDDHMLGVQMAADLCRKKGWTIDLEVDAPHDRLIDRIAASGHLIIGLSAGGIRALPNLTRLVLALRVSAPRAMILVSGNIVSEAKETLELLRVDGMSLGFEDALHQLEDFWDNLQNAE